MFLQQWYKRLIVDVPVTNQLLEKQEDLSQLSAECVKSIISICLIHRTNSEVYTHTHAHKWRKSSYWSVSQKQIQVVQITCQVNFYPMVSNSSPLQCCLFLSVPSCQMNFILGFITMYFHRVSCRWKQESLQVSYKKKAVETLIFLHWHY